MIHEGKKRVDGKGRQGNETERKGEEKGRKKKEQREGKRREMKRRKGRGTWLYNGGKMNTVRRRG